jgi:hypothetical protein
VKPLPPLVVIPPEQPATGRGIPGIPIAAGGILLVSLAIVGLVFIDTGGGKPTEAQPSTHQQDTPANARATDTATAARPADTQTPGSAQPTETPANASPSATTGTSASATTATGASPTTGNAATPTSATGGTPVPTATSASAPTPTNTTAAAPTPTNTSVPAVLSGNRTTTFNVSANPGNHPCQLGTMEVNFLIQRAGPPQDGTPIEITVTIPGAATLHGSTVFGPGFNSQGGSATAAGSGTYCTFTTSYSMSFTISGGSISGTLVIGGDHALPGGEAITFTFSGGAPH